MGSLKRRIRNIMRPQRREKVRKGRKANGRARRREEKLGKETKVRVMRMKMRKTTKKHKTKILNLRRRKS